VPYSCKTHHKSEFIGFGNDIRVFLTPTWLNQASNAGGSRCLNAIGEWEEGIASQTGPFGTFSSLFQRKTDGLDAVHLACTNT